RVAQTARNPDVALAIYRKPTGAETDLELVHLARIGCRKSGDKIGAAVGDPNPVLLVNREVEWPEHRVFQRVEAVTLKQPFALGRIPFGEPDDLTFFEVQGPDIAARCHDDTLHQAKLAVEVVTLRRRERLAVVIELHNRPAAVAGCPNVVVSINGHAKADAFEAAAGEA